MLLGPAPTLRRYIEIVTAEILCHLGCASIIWRCESGREVGIQMKQLWADNEAGGEVTGMHHAFYFGIFLKFPTSRSLKQNSSSIPVSIEELMPSSVSPACTSVCGWFQPALYNCQLFPPSIIELFAAGLYLLILVVFWSTLVVMLTSGVVYRSYLGGGGGGVQRERIITRAPHSIFHPHQN